MKFKEWKRQDPELEKKRLKFNEANKRCRARKKLEEFKGRAM